MTEQAVWPPVAEARPTPSPAPQVVLAAGTALVVRTGSEIGARSSQTGQAFQATLAQPLTFHGRIVVPLGVPVTGVIVAAKQGGKIQGGSDLAFQLTSIRVHGVSYPVVTEEFMQQEKGKGGRTTKLGVGGAAGGAIIGGIAGGGKGAAIGSLVGGGAGVAGSAFTGNKELKLPAESMLQFKLAQPLHLSSGAVPRTEDETKE